MIAAKELDDVPLFAALSAEWKAKIASTAAELHVQAGEWVIREGEAPFLFVLLEGGLICEKDYGGTHKVQARYAPGDFYGEIPILLDSVTIASLRATEPSRLLRLDPVQFNDLTAASPQANALVIEVMTRRLSMIRNHKQDNESLRVRVVGSLDDPECRAIRAFLSQNHVAYRWSDHANADASGPSIVVDQTTVVSAPLTTRRVADALGMRTTPSRQSYDVVVVGGGPAGLAAAVNGSSEGLDVLLVEKSAIGGQAACSTRIENYPGFPSGIAGNELGSRASKQALHFGADIVVTREVQAITGAARGHLIELDGGERVASRCVLLATGVQWRRLEAAGIDSLLDKGILYGAARTEANAVVGKKVFIVGGGNSAGQAAVFFSGYADCVTLLVRGKDLASSMSHYLIEQLERRPNVRIETSTEVVAAGGVAHLCSICTSANGTVRQREADALFVMIGAHASTAWIPGCIQRDPHGFILTGHDVMVAPAQRNPFALETSSPGVFCAGDIRHGSLKRVSSGMGEGSSAIALIHQYLGLPSVLGRTG